MDIICIGEILVDFIPGELPHTYICKAGGAPANVAVAAARNGLDAGVCGRVGADTFGDFLESTLRANGVTFLTPQRVGDAVTTMAFVTLDENGDRSFVFARKPGADMFLSADDVRSCGIENSSVVHAGSCSLSSSLSADATVFAIAEAKRLRKLVSFDVNYRDQMWNGDRQRAISAVKHLLPYIDMLKYSEEEQDFIDGALFQGGTADKVLVKTCGGRGAELIWAGQRFRVSGRPVKCVDATGAGDAFWGSFISCLINAGVSSMHDLTESLLLKALDYANIAGSICVQRKGAIDALPARSEIEAIARSKRSGCHTS